MRDLQLKTPTSCCNEAKLTWDKAKQYYFCKCGEVRADENGIPRPPNKRRKLSYGKNSRPEPSACPC